MFILSGEAYSVSKLSLLTYNEQINEAKKDKDLKQKYFVLNLGLSHPP